MLHQAAVLRLRLVAQALRVLCMQAVLLCFASDLRADELANADVAALSIEADHQLEAAGEPERLGPELPCESGDLDEDGLCNEIEAATGTRPLRADSDADGVPDGVEDANRDGVLDPGETDPRVPGLFPGGYPHIPEPLMFDLVRGLGAKRGEVEVNNLAVLGLRRRQQELMWAPEVEWAIADGIAVELELPMHNRELHAVKGAVQLTLPTARRNLTNGVQVIGEYALTAQDWRATALYLFGARMGKWSALAMIGGRTRIPLHRSARADALLNPSLYHDVTETLTVGVEVNLALGLDGDHAVTPLPQVHWQITRSVRVQIGGGVSFQTAYPTPLLAARIILE